MRGIAGFGLSIAVLAGGLPATAGLSEQTLAAVAALTEQQAAASNRTDRLVLPGLVADRTAGTVRLWAEATGVGRHDPIEFILIGPESGHDYEAFAMAAARPGDVHRALTFIGLEPGRPINPRALVFWPKGERVVMQVATADTNLWPRPLRAEQLVRIDGTGATMPPLGFVFTGSYRVDATDGGGSLYAADTYGPHSIASVYNEPGSVLDVPVQAPQGTVYGQQLPNPDALLPSNALLVVTLTPERSGEAPRIRELSLTVAPPPKNAAAAGPAFELGGPEGGPLDVPGLVAAFVAITAAGHDPFVTVRFAPELSLAQAREAAMLIAGLEGPEGIRVEPPPEDQLYYRAFIPNEGNRRREDRLIQPLELHLSAEGQTPPATLVRIEETWPEDDGDPVLTEQVEAVDTPEGLRRLLDGDTLGLPVLLVFAGPRSSYARLMAFVKPALPTHGNVHVYLAAESGDRP